MSAPADLLLEQLAEAAGLQVGWRDAQGSDRRVAADTLRSVLKAMEIPCGNESQCRDSLRGLSEEARCPPAPALHIVKSGAPVILRLAGSPHYRLRLEDGTRIMGTARDLGGGHVAIPGVRRPGYHQLEMGRISATVAVVPQRCPSVGDLLGRRHGWVVGAQVYSLRRKPAQDGPPHEGVAGGAPLPGWEVGGDFSAVGRLARQAAEQGAAGLAISPVHAMFSADAGRYSPYSPSSRLFLNAMYADPAAVFAADVLGPLLLQGGPAVANADGCMDWPDIQARRLAQLRRLYEGFVATRPEALSRDFDAFRLQGGEALASHACYEALHAHHAPELGAGHGWRDWAADYRDPQGEAVRRFARSHEKALGFHAFLQWLAARSLADAHAGAVAAGMPMGLVADMAVGTDPRGSHAWCRQRQIMSGVSVGAPPDPFQPDGQCWGLTAFSPRALRLNGYDGFIETLRAVLAQAGGLRVDHVLGLARMWLVPAGGGATEGVYLRYPREDLMDLLVLEAWRHQAVVVGENLGTIPDGFNDILAQRGILGTSVLWFEREPGEPPFFRAREDWPAQAMAMATTHDLPTLRGWWRGRDIEWRTRLGQFDRGQADAQRASRETQKLALWTAMRDAGLVAPDTPMPEHAPSAEMLAYVASTPAALFNVAVEDLLGLEEQPNLPENGAARAGERHPNWCRALDVPVDRLLQGDDVSRLLRAVRQAREAAVAPRGERL